MALTPLEVQREFYALLKMVREVRRAALLVLYRDIQLKTSNGVNPVASGGNTDFVDILPCAKSTGHSSNGVKRAPEALKIRLIIMLT